MAVETFIARQPIFDRELNVQAYELLHRSDLEGPFVHGDPDEASAQLIRSSLLVGRLRELTGGKPAFINFTETLLLQELVELLPPEAVVVELLETVTAGPRIIDAVRDLKDKGYRIALDDFVNSTEMAPLVELADIIKVDFLETNHEDRRRLKEDCERPGLAFLAEKVETQEDVDDAMALGYSMFQGFFFCRPKTFSHREIPHFQANYIALITQVIKPELDLDAIEQTFKSDVSLSARLLQYMNTAKFGLREPATSIQRALIHMGEAPLRRWALLIGLAGLGDDKPDELLVTCLVRARFCECLAESAGLEDRELPLFLTGMFSALDALVDLPIGEALRSVGVGPEIEDAICNGKSPMGRVLGLAQASERGEVDKYVALAESFHLPQDDIAIRYAEAMIWANEIFERASG